MTKSLSVSLAEIPLYLIPRAVAELIRVRGDAVYRVSIRRTHWHHYNVSVRTRRVKKELAPERVAVIETADGTDINGNAETFASCRRHRT